MPCMLCDGERKERDEVSERGREGGKERETHMVGESRL